MAKFQQQPLRQQQTIGEQLHTARQARGLSISDLAKKLKISERYLEALERGKYNDLPSPVYIKNYLRIYAKEVGIAWEKIEGLFKSEIGVYQNKVEAVKKKTPLQVKKTGKKKSVGRSGAHQKALLVPRLFKYGLIGIIVLLLTVYFAWGIVRLVSPPELAVNSPEGDVIVTEQKIIIEGQTEPEAIVEINGQGVAVELDGEFSEEVYLREGLNSLRITAKSKRSQERVEVRNVLYDIDEEIKTAEKENKKKKQE